MMTTSAPEVNASALAGFFEVSVKLGENPSKSGKSQGGLDKNSPQYQH